MSIDHFAYAHHGSNFMGCDDLAQHPLAVVGVPWDGGVTHRPGARFAPHSIRRASHALCDATHPVFDLSPVRWCGDAGNLQIPNASGLQVAREAIAQQALPLMQKHHCIFLGGDHSVTLALLQALHQVHGPLALVHVDAHCDTWSDHFGEAGGHGTWTREAIEMGLISPQHTVQMGLRSPAERQAREYVRERGGLIFTARDLWGLEGPFLNPCVNEIRRHIGHRPTYLTLDIDGLDPAYAPGTGTPEPGGLSTRQVLWLIESLADLEWVGMDCVEVCPPFDVAELTSLAASTLVWSYLSAQVAKRVHPLQPHG